MGLREEVVEVLRAGDTTRVEHVAVTDRRAMRHLLGRLWDQDSGVRHAACIGVGAAAAAHPDVGLDVVRRLMWALNDESATNGVYGIAALGEIGARDPALIGPFVGPLASYSWDDGLRLEILKALVRIAAVAPRIVAPHLPQLEPHIDPEDHAETELAAHLRTLGKEEHDEV
jgi:hypothetical protein